MWVEKYRPRSLDDIRDQDEIVRRLKRFVEAKAMPHCLFAGPPGTGKTTAALCLAHDMFGERFHEAFMELNASDARGIDVIRTTVKDFARAASISGLPFKILVLDEADNMTADAQHAMRRTMERYTQTCRFILCANYSGRIIEPIQSRCAIFRFTPLGEGVVADFLREIAEKEGVKIGEDGLKAIVRVAEGDMRKAINTLQAAASMDRPVDEAAVYSVLGLAKPGEVDQLLEKTLSGRIDEARSILRSMLWSQGVSGLDLLKQIYRRMLDMNLPGDLKVDLVDTVGEVEYRLSQGADEEIQLTALLAKLSVKGVPG
ncbi:MAG: replication factor C small subunit [Candidatus Bathyarchaeia archaeon]|nr:replication factor C small subunit [Candidatus Bathyarchaeota archaeon]